MEKKLSEIMLLLFLKKIFIYCSALVLILPVAANAHAMTLAVEQEPGFCNQLLDVRINEDKLSLHADQVPLQCILRHMANIGIKIRIDPLINPKISASFEDRDIQKGVDAILKPFSYILIWESIQDPLSSPVKLSEIRIFKPGNKELMRPLHSGAVLSIVRNPKDGSLFVKNEILLRLKSEINLLEFKRLLKQINGRVVGRNDALGIYKIILPENSDISSLVKQLTNHPGVAKAEPNYAYPIAAPFKISARVIPVSSASNISEQGGEARIAILDTGLSHDSRLKDFVPASFDALNPNESISDSLGHGTQMSLIAAGVVEPYGVKTDSETDRYNPIIPIRVFDDNGFTSNFALIESIDFALNNGARVMSLS
ncbi:MAG: S8/S53 family peptidase, partial [Deltaproteobacteria bacterium]|nr:S8/S53 family peptidase [Deltaproteobacteria bacterium]